MHDFSTYVDKKHNSLWHRVQEDSKILVKENDMICKRGSTHINDQEKRERSGYTLQILKSKKINLNS